jgi:hypothetical protein
VLAGVCKKNNPYSAIAPGLAPAPLTIAGIHRYDTNLQLRLAELRERGFGDFTPERRLNLRLIGQRMSLAAYRNIDALPAGTGHYLSDILRDLRP